MKISGNVEINETEKINIANPDYFEKLGKLINKTDKRTLVSMI
jgi:hypothetical protein